MATAAFIILEDLGAGPVSKFDWTDSILMQVDGIRSATVRRMLRNHLDCTDGAAVHLVVGRLETFRDRLLRWPDDIAVAQRHIKGPLKTSHGDLGLADLPSILSAISILDPIIAAARGEVVELREVA